MIRPKGYPRKEWELISKEIKRQRKTKTISGTRPTVGMFESYNSAPSVSA